VIVALDLAHCSGIGVWDYKGPIQVFTIEGSPIAQLALIESILVPSAIVVYEKHVHFRNAGVTRTLNELNGYIHISLMAEGYSVFSHFPGKGRKELYEAYLELTKDEKDAAILIDSFLQLEKPLAVERTTYRAYQDRFSTRRSTT
jgi:hypothetical protein